ncbi:MAG: ribonuclease T [Alphaproteobacteria bacterium]|nr:ribonuclease T [Alphaproteobacteria bacterium]
MLKRSCLLAAFLCSTLPALAQQPLEGWLIATKACEAYQSKNRLTNPGDVRIVENFAYGMIGINKLGGEWYQIRMPEAPVTQARWVHITCGPHVVASGPVPDPGVGPTDTFTPREGMEATDLMLALSWQPSFCEKKPSKPECRQLNDGLLPITERRLSLHGLWPQPRENVYCGVSESIKRIDKPDRWDELPAPELDADTADRLAVAMPGTASFLERHEWIKHGTCFFGDRSGDEYYDDTLLVMDAINESEVGHFLAANVGAEIETSDLLAAFDTAFGDGAGDRVQVACTGDQGRVLVQELKIALLGEITETVDVGELILAAAPQSPGCPRGVLDPAGLQ